MTDTELFEIVKGHREAWPDVYEPLILESGLVLIVRNDEPPIGRVYVDEADDADDCTVLMFEASFHRALIARTNVSVDKWPDGYIVRVQSHSFESPRLIEAYAAALEWLK
jgi:hypothetical protein